MSSLLKPIPLTLTSLLLGAFVSMLPAPASNAANGPVTRFSRPPLYALTRDDNDAAQLSDGRTTLGTMWTSREGVGWRSDGRPIEIDLDLGGARPIGRICLHSARGAEADVHFPRRIEVFSSADGRRFAWEADAAAGQDISDGPYLARWFCTRTLSRIARTISLVVEPSGPYFMTDEIRIDPAEAALRGPNGPDIEAGQLIAFSIRRQAALLSAEALTRSLSTEAGAGNAVPPMRGIAQDIASGAATGNLRSLSEIETRIRAAVHAARASNGAAIRLRQADPYGRSTPFDAAPLADPVRLELGRGMHGALALALDNLGSGDADLEISAEVTGPAAPGIALGLFRAEPVLLLDGRWTGDPLLPIGHELHLPFGESRQLWIDVSAAAGGPAGDAIVRIAVRRGGVLQASMNLPMRLWTINPPASSPATVVWGYLNQLPIRRYPEAAAADMLAHGVDTAVLTGNQLPWPGNARAATIGNYAAFDAAMRTLRGRRSFLFYFGWGEEGRELGGYRYMTPQWRDLFARWLREWVGRMREEGIGYDRFALYPVDEPGTPAARSTLIAAARLIRAIDPHVRIYTTINHPEMVSDEMIDLVDIFQINGAALSCDLVTRLSRRGRTVWAYQTEGGGKAADPGSFYRAQGWQAFAAGLSGFGFWSYADIGRTGTAWTDLDEVRPDFAVVYDMPNGFVSSKRWEAWREGVQDFRLLSAALRGARTDAERQLVMSLAGTGSSASAPAILNRTRATLMALAARDVSADAPDPARGCNPEVLRP